NFVFVPRGLKVLVAVEFCWHDTVSMVVRRRPLFANSKGGARLLADIQQRKANGIIRPVAVIRRAATSDSNAAKWTFPCG
ncbi:hypothetical protein, partial [Acidithiobacillus ferrivorans]|uniref:hypothetical protein n=1 Tax=Acidithiobacillus ferrivorans TaxID=160808 RepID=UPI001CBEB1B9